MRTALYFGSFNPFHAGHAAIARWILTEGGLHRLVLVVSPKNPLKERAENISPIDRLNQVRGAATRLAAEPQLKAKGKQIEVSDIEFSMQEPLYTIKTLRKFRETEPGVEHILVIGSDNLEIIEQWNSWQELLAEFEVWVYPRRQGTFEELNTHHNSATHNNVTALCAHYGVKLIDAPYLDISSTKIREMELRGEETGELKY
jgi:nicotinate-nucleotide adenylyltransferase